MMHGAYNVKSVSRIWYICDTEGTVSLKPDKIFHELDISLVLEYPDYKFNLKFA